MISNENHKILNEIKTKLFFCKDELEIFDKILSKVFEANIQKFRTMENIDEYEKIIDKKKVIVNKLISDHLVFDKGTTDENTFDVKGFEEYQKKEIGEFDKNYESMKKTFKRFAIFNNLFKEHHS